MGRLHSTDRQSFLLRFSCLPPSVGVRCLGISARSCACNEFLRRQASWRHEVLDADRAAFLDVLQMQPVEGHAVHDRVENASPDGSDDTDASDAGCLLMSAQLSPSSYLGRLLGLRHLDEIVDCVLDVDH